MKIFREIMLTILPSLAMILLIVGIVLYNFNPTTASLPEVPVYTTSSEVSAEINTSGIEDEKEIIQTYSVTQSQLDTYEQASSYIPGKAHPFSTYVSSSNDVDVNGDGVIDEQDTQAEEDSKYSDDSYTSNDSTGK